MLRNTVVKMTTHQLGNGLNFIKYKMKFNSICPTGLLQGLTESAGGKYGAQRLGHSKYETSFG